MTYQEERLGEDVPHSDDLRSRAALATDIGAVDGSAARAWFQSGQWGEAYKALAAQLWESMHVLGLPEEAVSTLIEDTHAVSTLNEDHDDDPYPLPRDVDWLADEEDRMVLAAYLDAYSQSALPAPEK